MARVARAEWLGLLVVGVLVFVAAGCGASSDLSAEARGSAQSVASVVVETVPAVPSIADPSIRLVTAYVPDGYVLERESRPKTDHGNLVINQHFVEAVGNRPTPGGPIGRGSLVINVANVPGLTARNITDAASLIVPGGEPTVESRTSVQGVPAAVLGEPAGPVINHAVIFARGDWSFEIASPTVSVDELIRIAESVSLQ